MFRFVKKIKISFIKKQKLINEIEYLKKRNDFLDDMLKNLETISYNSLNFNCSFVNFIAILSKLIIIIHTFIIIINNSQ